MLSRQLDGLLRVAWGQPRFFLFHVKCEHSFSNDVTSCQNMDPLLNLIYKFNQISSILLNALVTRKKAFNYRIQSKEVHLHVIV